MVTAIKVQCKCGRDDCDALNRHLHRFLLESGLADQLGMRRSAPRYRYYQVKRTKGKSERTFEWTTETAEEGKYWAVERRWVQVKGGQRGKIVRKVGFRQRNKAKARAYDWYCKAKATA